MAIETPTVLTALDRVVSAEVQKIQDDAYDKFSSELDTLLDSDHLPMGQSDYKKVVKRLKRSSYLQLEKDLAFVLNFQEIIEESSKFGKRITDRIA